MSLVHSCEKFSVITTARKRRPLFPASADFILYNIQISWWENFLAESNVWAAFGCHPHYASSFGDEEEGYLRHALQHAKTLALGEIGLDYSSK